MKNTPNRGGLYSPFGRGEWQPAMAGSLHPPFSLFLARRKRENGPCTVQKRKRSIAPAGGRGTGARLNDWRSQNDYPRAIGSHGGCSSLNGQAPLFAAAPRCSRESCVYRALKNSAPKEEEGLPLKNGRPSIHFRPPGQRQRKEELVHSSRDKPPLNLIARGKSFRLRRSFSRAPVASPVTSFSLLDRARPVFSFSSGKKNRGPRAACRVGRGGRNGAERSPRR